ncbi:mevalonate kinase [Planctomycetota bacterium]
MVLTGEAHGKLLLFGEHAVVYGHPALGLTLPLTMRVTLTPTEASVSTQTNHDLLEHLIRTLDEDAQRRWQEHVWQVNIQSDIPRAGGFGSSAALCGALARALTIHPNKQLIRTRAHQAEHYFHGTPSGVDTALALGRGLSAFDPRTQTSGQITAPPFAFIAGALPRSENTRTLIARVHDQSQSHAQVLTTLGNLAQETITTLPTLKQTEASRFLGEQAQAAHRFLADLGLSTPVLDQIVPTALQAGATGGKLSGAGGGGAFVLFCADSDTAERIRSIIDGQFGNALLHLAAYFWDGQTLQTVIESRASREDLNKQ